MDIKILTDKFMDGTSSLEEEQLLEEYFRNGKDIPKELEPYREMFAYFDGGMADDSLLREKTPEDETEKLTDADKAVDRHHGLTVAMRRTVAVAAAVAALLVIAYSLIGGHDGSDSSSETGKRAIAQAVATDSINTAEDSTLNMDGRQGNEEREHRVPRKFRYKPAPPEVLTADAGPDAAADSINREAARLADAELRRVETEQQYMLNIIKAANLLNSMDIAAAADEEVY